jgi:hypothetical protein
VVNFDLQFQFTLIGREFLTDTLTIGFRLTPGKYVLGDAAYFLIPYHLAPYCSVCYYIKQFKMEMMNQGIMRCSFI